MIGSFRLIFTVALFLGTPFALATIFLIPGMSRKRFSLLTTLIVAGEMFMLTIIFGEEHKLMIGTVLFLLLLPSGYLAMYILYPGTKARYEKRNHLK